MAVENPDVFFMKVDINHCQGLGFDYEKSIIPSFLFFKNGAQVAQWLGASKNKLKELVNKHK